MFVGTNVGTSAEAARRALDTHLADLGEFVARLDPAAVHFTEAPDLWHRFDQIERVASAGKVLLAGRAPPP